MNTHNITATHTIVILYISQTYITGHPPLILSPVMPFPVIEAIPAGIAAAVGKGAATAGGSVIGVVASYAIIDAVNGNEQPQIQTAILSSASNNESDSLLAVNFGGTESGIVIVSIILIAALIIYKCCATCRYKCCKNKKQSSKKIVMCGTCEPGINN